MTRDEDEAGPFVVFANFLSDLAVDLEEGEALATWAQQAPRKAWLLRAGDVLVTPVPLSREFLRYVYGLTGVAAGDVSIVEVPAPRTRAVPLADAVRAAGLVRHVRDLARDRGAALLPTALDASAVGFAREVGVTVHPYPTVDDAAAALRASMLLNTKAGFREVAEQLGMRVPRGRVCRRSEVARVVREFLRSHERVVVKPDRSAGGHGMRFLARGELAEGADPALDTVGGPQGVWVVEECLDVAHSVSVQLECGASGTRVLFSGAMRTAHGAFTGYVSPLPADCARAAGELEDWGTRLGRHLSALGYAGPFGLDALVTGDGEVFASESNIRRTATTTPYAMVRRLTGVPQDTRPAWSVAKGRSRRSLGFAEVLKRLEEHGLAFDPARAEGVVPYADAPQDGRSWRYAVIAGAGDADGLREQEARLAAALEFEGR
ncbi:hypothetical protein SAVIM338S_00229 [Streptomyces avidinii]